MSVAASSVAVAHGVGRTVDRLLAHPRVVVGALVGAQIALTLVLALSVDHNGWVWFQGGDQIWMTTTGWLLGQARATADRDRLPLAGRAGAVDLGDGTDVRAGASRRSSSGQVLVLGPIALLCVYGIAARIGGRLLAYWASFLWVIAPFAAIPLFVDRYQERWSEQFLPQALGLTAMADFPSMVVVLAGVLFVVRSLSPGRVPDAVMAGLLIGAAGCPEASEPPRRRGRRSRVRRSPPLA